MDHGRSASADSGRWWQQADCRDGEGYPISRGIGVTNGTANSKPEGL